MGEKAGVQSAGLSSGRVPGRRGQRTTWGSWCVVCERGGQMGQGSSVGETEACMKPWKDQNGAGRVKSWRVGRGGVKISLQDTVGGRKRKWDWDK